MPETERKENSVLFSLKELRRIEDGRVTAEEDERMRQEEAERRAREEAERMRREEEERKIREEQERVRQEQEERQKAEREAHLRLKEAEIRAKAEQEAAMEAERMRLEMEASATGGTRIPVWAVVTGIVVLLGAIGGLGYYLYHQSQERKKQEAAQALREKQMKEELAKLKKDQDELRRINQQKDALIEKMRTASVEEKKNILAQVNKLKDKARYLSESINKRRSRRGRRRSRGSSRGSGSSGPRRVRSSSNPLDGL